MPGTVNQNERNRRLPVKKRRPFLLQSKQLKKKGFRDESSSTDSSTSETSSSNSTSGSCSSCDSSSESYSDYSDSCDCGRCESLSDSYTDSYSSSDESGSSWNSIKAVLMLKMPCGAKCLRKKNTKLGRLNKKMKNINKMVDSPHMLDLTTSSVDKTDNTSASDISNANEETLLLEAV